MLCPSGESKGDQGVVRDKVRLIAGDTGIYMRALSNTVPPCRELCES